MLRAGLRVFAPVLLTVIAFSQHALAAPSRDMTALAPGTPTRPVQLSKIVVKLDRGQPYGKLKVGLLCIGGGRLAWKTGRHELDIDDFDDVFRERLEAAGLDVVGGTVDMFETDLPGRAEFLVGGTIRSMAVDACIPNSGLGDTQSVKGTASLAIDWQLYSRFDRKVVARAETTGSYRQPKADLSGIGGLVVGAFADNIRGLLATAVLQKALAGTPSDPRVARIPTGRFAPLTMRLSGPVAGSLADAVGATVLIQSGSGHGSGFLISSDGYFLTNHHVVGSSKYVKLRWSDGLEAVGEVIRSDPGRDIALVAGDGRKRLPLRMRSEGGVVGEEVYAIGAPLDPALQNSLTRGVVSARRIQDGYSFLQSDVSVQRGNSGGPLVDGKSRVVGVAQSGLQIQGASTGLNFFVPADEALAFLSIVDGSASQSPGTGGTSSGPLSGSSTAGASGTNSGGSR